MHFVFFLFPRNSCARRTKKNLGVISWRRAEVLWGRRERVMALVFLFVFPTSKLFECSSLFQNPGTNINIGACLSVGCTSRGCMHFKGEQGGISRGACPNVSLNVPGAVCATCGLADRTGAYLHSVASSLRLPSALFCILQSPLALFITLPG